MKAEEFIKSAEVVNFDDVEYVTEEDALEAVQMACERIVRKWSMFCFNYHTPFEVTISKIWGGSLVRIGERYICRDNMLTQHLIDKWRRFESRGDARMLHFYCELDNENRSKFVNWIIENYTG